MQPIASAFRPSDVVIRRMRRRGMLSAAVLVTALTVTAVAGFDAESRGAASTAATPGNARVSDRVHPPALTPSHRPAASQPSASASKHSALPSPCARNPRSQLIVVNIKHQHEWACAHHRTVLSTPVTTGASSRPGDATPRGVFAVQGLDRNSVLTTTGARNYRVKFWIPFHLGVWGFHDASWQKMPFGSKQYVTRGSHGCVHMPLAAIRWLFHWVHYGTRVRIS
jgi:lipoprotein-anchoring transpeptidase ErfK/SrfK